MRASVARGLARQRYGEAIEAAQQAITLQPDCVVNYYRKVQPLLKLASMAADS